MVTPVFKSDFYIFPIMNNSGKFKKIDRQVFIVAELLKNTADTEILVI